ncbi:hypothetical protein CCMSSC00406_0009226 [Pleurotus cornucopiae]|uniref:Uncharacterized protein n=1 Tax=Pleurotus cornucopiae TaxID=5321 RepID=A0ACB7J064_PLECO|nr:hypothetical protein CCMSSC00406_0009226 [Pleurotus cornucopiae]
MPSSSPLKLRHPHLGEDSGGSSVSSSNDYQYGARPRQTQLPTSLIDFRHRQHIPDTVIEPSLRESHTSGSRSQHSERRSTQYEPDRSTFAQAFGPMREAPRAQYETPQTYPPAGSQHYNKHDYIFCPGEEPPATAAFLDVRIENKVDTPVMHEYDREHRYTNHYNEEIHVGWHRHEPRASAPWSPSHTSPNNSRRLPIQPQAAAFQTRKISAASASSWLSPLRQEGRSVDWLHRRSTTSPTPFPTHRLQNSSDSGHLPVRHLAPPTEATDMHEYDREHRYTDPYARYNEGTRIDWHRHEPRTSTPWSPKYTSPNSSRHLPIQPQAPVSASSTSWPSPSPHEGRSVDWLHHRSATSALLPPTHTSPNASALEYVPVRRQPPPIEPIDAAFTPPSEWESSASSHGVQAETGPLPQPPKGTNKTYPHVSSLRPSPSGRDGEREENGDETETYGGFASARTSADHAQADVSGNEIGRHSQKDTVAPSVAESGLEVGANTERPVANTPSSLIV